MSAGPDQVAEVAARTGDEYRPDTLSGYIHLWWQGVKFGEIGSLPIIIGLGVIVVIFGILDSTFLSERNFTNLLLQMSYVAIIAIGVVFVLLIGEIDLSVAYVSAVGGVVTTLLASSRQSGLAVVGGRGRGSSLHDGDRLLPGVGDHEDRSAVVRGDARGPAHLVRRRSHPDDERLQRREPSASRTTS